MGLVAGGEQLLEQGLLAGLGWGPFVQVLLLWVL